MPIESATRTNTAQSIFGTLSRHSVPMIQDIHHLSWGLFVVSLICSRRLASDLCQSLLVPTIASLKLKNFKESKLVAFVVTVACLRVSLLPPLMPSKRMSRLHCPSIHPTPFPPHSHPIPTTLSHTSHPHHPSSPLLLHFPSLHLKSLSYQRHHPPNFWLGPIGITWRDKNRVALKAPSSCMRLTFLNLATIMHHLVSF